MKGQSSVGAMRHVVTLDNPGAAVADGDSGYTQAWTPLTPPSWYCSIETANARDLERIAAGSVLSTASHIVTGRYHAGITTKTRITFNGRTLNVTGVSNPEERNIETVALCVEVVA